jgi:transmembrane sensor
MDNLARELERARQELAPQWNEERSARLYAGTLQRKRRRAVRRAALAAAAACAVAGVLVVARQPSRQLAQSQPDHPVSGGDHTLRLADGSLAKMVGERSELEVTHNTPERVAFKLLSGRAHFDVVPNPSRSFTVEVRPYRIEVIGTVFDVERSEHEVAVHVTHGKVRVYGPYGARDVSAGDRQRFATEADEGTAAPRDPADADLVEDEEHVLEREEQEARPRARRRGGAATAVPKWRSLSQSGDYEAAFESLRRGAAVDDDPAALMDAADAARLSGHPQSAVQYLERVVRGHRKSPVAPLAAFTLGRVYLDKLGQPDRAARAFELARSLAPSGSLAQDALAREVEALSKGGHADKANLRAQEYLKRYPSGRRVRAVQLYGGME